MRLQTNNVEVDVMPNARLLDNSRHLDSMMLLPSEFVLNMTLRSVIRILPSTLSQTPPMLLVTVWRSTSNETAKILRLPLLVLLGTVVTDIRTLPKKGKTEIIYHPTSDPKT
jgi:hypothetical protein